MKPTPPESLPESVEKKLLAEWFWIDRWDGSSAVLLPMEAQGIYRAMLSQAWRRGAALPADLEEVQLLIRCKPSEWARSWPRVQKYWRLQDGLLVNDTQREVYAVALAKALAESKKGRDAANKRWGNHPEDDQAPDDTHAMPGHMPEQCPPSPSPDPSRTPNGHPPPTPPSREGRSRSSSRGTAAVPRGEVLAWTETLAAEMIAAGGEATRNWKRDVKRKLEGQGLERGVETVRRWIEKQRERVRSEAEEHQAAAAVRALVRRARSTGREEWAAVLAQLEARLDKHQLYSWIRPMAPLGIVDDGNGAELVLGVLSAQTLGWIERNYLKAITEAIAAAGLALVPHLVVPPADIAE
jgi:uncharacterized protein YdaU (DUF1376 family)